MTKKGTATQRWNIKHVKINRGVPPNRDQKELLLGGSDKDVATVKVAVYQFRTENFFMAFEDHFEDRWVGPCRDAKFVQWNERALCRVYYSDGAIGIERCGNTNAAVRTHYTT